jgi:hypothetical protein
MGIAARSTNTKGYVHFGGDVVSGVEDGIGVKVGSASTGATAWIEPISDSDTAAIGLRAKGAAALTLGNSSNTVNILGSAITLTGAGSPIKGAYSTTFAYAYAALTSGAFAEANIASTTADIMPGDLFHVELGLTTDALALMGTRTSTATASRVVLVLGNIASTAFGATNSGTGRITWLDLT